MAFEAKKELKEDNKIFIFCNTKIKRGNFMTISSDVCEDKDNFAKIFN